MWAEDVLSFEKRMLSEVERLLPSTGGYDVTFSKPLSSRQQGHPSGALVWIHVDVSKLMGCSRRGLVLRLLRLEAVIQCPAICSDALARHTVWPHPRHSCGGAEGDSEPLFAPLTRRPCVLYTVSSLVRASHLCGWCPMYPCP